MVGSITFLRGANSGKCHRFLTCFPHLSTLLRVMISTPGIIPGSIENLANLQTLDLSYTGTTWDGTNYVGGLSGTIVKNAYSKLWYSQAKKGTRTVSQMGGFQVCSNIRSRCSIRSMILQIVLMHAETRS